MNLPLEKIFKFRKIVGIKNQVTEKVFRFANKKLVSGNFFTSWKNNI